MNKIELENFIIDELIKWSGSDEEGFQQVASRILEGILEEIIDDCPHFEHCYEIARESFGWR